MRTQITIAAQPEGLGGSNPHRSSSQSHLLRLSLWTVHFTRLPLPAGS